MCAAKLGQRKNSPQPGGGQTNLGMAPSVPLDRGVPGFLRFMGLFNAAVWVGGSVFFSFLAAPVFFTAEVTAFAPKPANGLIAQAVLGRYFMLHIICGMIDSLLLLIWWLYNGCRFPNRSFAVRSVLLCLLRFGGPSSGDRRVGRVCRRRGPPVHANK